MNQKSAAPGPNRPRTASKPRAGFFLSGLAIAALAAALFWWNRAPAPVAQTVVAKVPAPPPAGPVLSPPDQPAVSLPPTADEPAPSPAERLAAAVTLLTSPTLDATAVQQARALIDSAYAPLYQQLGLSPTDATALGDLLSQRLDADRTGLAAAAAQGLTLADNPAEVALVVRAAVTPVEIQIRALLGGDGYQQYQAFAAPIRTAVAAALRQNQR